MNGPGRKRRRRSRKKESCIYDIMDTSGAQAIVFPFRLGFGSPPGILLGRLLWFLEKASKQAKELREFMFSSQQLYSPATRFDEPALVLYSTSLIQKK
jgi:hypothetical protein